MRILVLGGTVFLGRHVVEAAVAAGHDVALFNRGRHNPELFPDVEKLRGDREGDVDALAGRTFDAVIDTSAYTVAHVKNIHEALDGRVGHYTFVSSISAYAGLALERVSEDAPLQELPEIPSGEELNSAYYGAQKAEGERRVTEAFGERAFVVRPGMIVGPEDPIDRYVYWLRRMDETGEVIAPGDPKSPIQVIDVRDLAGWMMSGVEQQLSGVFNATGPAQRLSRRDFLERSAAGIGSDAQLVWISDEFLLQHEVGPFEELPYWVPTNPDLAGFFAVDISPSAARTYCPRHTVMGQGASAAALCLRRLRDLRPRAPARTRARGGADHHLAKMRTRSSSVSPACVDLRRVSTGTRSEPG